MLSPVRLSVCPSVTRVYRTKTIEVKIMKFLPYGSPIHLVFAGSVSSRNSNESPKQGCQKGRVRKTRYMYFLALNVNISKTVGDASKVTIRPND